MSRLIDADKLILHLNDYALQEAPFGRNDSKNQKEIYETIKECMKAVEEQPTAFDVEEVIEQLKALPRGSTWNHNSDNINRDKAIEIVKRCGRDEK